LGGPKLRGFRRIDAAWEISKFETRSKFTWGGFNLGGILHKIVHKGDMLGGKWFAPAALNPLPGSFLLPLPTIPFPNPVSPPPPIPPKMKVHIKVRCSDSVEISNHETSMTWGHWETEMMISEASDMKTSRGTSQNGVKSQTHRSFRKSEGVSFEHRQQMEGSTRRGRRVMNRWIELAEDHMLKLLSTLEIPVLDKPPKLLILVKLQQIPRATTRNHGKK
jgi:hypothetical protein